jgi:hypothetical protein
MSSGSLTLEQVQGAWERVLQIVRQRNPATQAVLNTGCRPAEVNGVEIIVTFPFPFMREKLRDPQRLMEIQDALSEVLGVKCIVRLVLATDYEPRSPVQPASPEVVANSVSAGSPDNVLAGTTPVEQVPDEISRWAAERGGQAKVVQ